MTTEERIFERGRKIGIELEKQIGIEIGIEQIIKNIMVRNPKFSDTQIADLTDIPIPVIEKVRHSINKK